MTTFTAPFSIQIPNYSVAQPAALPHYTTVYAMDINGNVVENALTGQAITVLAGQIKAGNTVEVDTGLILPAHAIVTDVFLNVLTAEATGATKTVKVGLLSTQVGGNAQGFLNGVSVATTGIKRGVATVTAGGTETFYASTTRGALFVSNFKAGSNVAGDTGINYEHPFLSDSVTAKDVSFTRGSVFVECVANIYVTYIAF